MQAWYLLGLCQAESDKDYHAITALEKAVSLDAMNSDALMALAVSYTNESNKLKVRSFERWSLFCDLPRVVGVCL